jgi:gliding motility-associated-like protein
MIKYLYIFILTIAAFVTNAQNLSVTFNKTERACELAEASAVIVTATPPIYYLWSNNAMTSSVDGLEPGDYWVKVTADGGMDTTIYFSIEELVCEPKPETHFTPNFDGFNDTWSIGRMTNFPDFDLFVYNRWGQQVHHQTNDYIPWDGRNLGLPLPDATYYYILYFSKTDKNKFVKGPVSIIR